MKTFIRNCVHTTLSLAPTALLQRVTKSSCMTYYHMVSEVPPSYFGGDYPVATPRQFEKQIDFFLKHWHPITLHELLSSIRATGSIPEKAFHLTFDDGYREVYDVIFPILQRKGVSATTFLCTNSLDNRAWMWENRRALLLYALRGATSAERGEVARMMGTTVEMVNQRLNRLAYHERGLMNQIAERLQVDEQLMLQQKAPYLSIAQIQGMMDAGFTFGSHSLDHPPFQKIDTAEQRHQIITSIQVLQDTFNIEHRVFAFPYGEFSLPGSLFETLFREDRVAACFGTRGLLHDEYPYVVQRLWMETPHFSARRTVNGELAQKLIRQWVSNDKVTRRA